MEKSKQVNSQIVLDRLTVRIKQRRKEGQTVEQIVKYVSMQALVTEVALKYILTKEEWLALKRLLQERAERKREKRRKAKAQLLGNAAPDSDLIQKELSEAQIATKRYY